ncbi:Short-chain dehydrogenase/reductase family 16C member 6, partial [Operophtera brumata]
MSVETQNYINGMRPGPLSREIPECMRDKYTVVQTIIDIILFIITEIGHVVQSVWRTIVGVRKRDLNGGVAVVTGGGGGLGSLIALRLARLGCTVVLWDINKQ